MLYERSAEHFAKGSDYQMVVDERISILVKYGTTEHLSLMLRNFDTKHSILLKKSSYYKYIFAFTTEMFRNCYKTEKYSASFKKYLKWILWLGLESKYVYSPLSADTEFYSPLSADTEKHTKYSRDIVTERGIINCLYRETKTFCNCMKPFKIEGRQKKNYSVYEKDKEI